MYDNYFEPKSLLECFKEDSIPQLRFYMNARNLPGKSPFQQFSDHYTFEGEDHKVSSAIIATHFRAIKCLSEFQMPIFDSIGLTPLHVAFYENWVEGVKLFLPKADKRILTCLSKTKKSPLAVFADKQNISLIPFVVETLKQIKEASKKNDGTSFDPLDCVFKEKDEDVSFLTYIVKNKITRIINSLHFFVDNGLISTNQLTTAISKWDSLYKGEKMPAYFRMRAMKEDNTKELTIKKWKNASSFQTPFADLKDSQFYNPVDVMANIHSIFDVVKPCRSSLRLLNFYQTGQSVLKEYPEQLRLDDNIYTTRTPGFVLNAYFHEIDKCMKIIEWCQQDPETTDYVALIKGPNPNYDISIFKDFGLVLAHVTFAGCNVRLPFSLDPLIYRALLTENVEIPSEEKEYYVMAINPSEYLTNKKKWLDTFWTSQKQNKIRDEFTKPVFSQIKQNYYDCLAAIREGFCSSIPKNYDDSNAFLRHAFIKYIHLVTENIPNLLALSSKKTFPYTMNIPSLKLWFEGAFVESNEDTREYWFKRFRIAYAKEKDEEYNESQINEEIFRFFHLIEDQMEKFIITLFGITGTIPFQNKICSLIFTTSSKTIPLIKLIPEGQLVIQSPSTPENLSDIINNIENASEEEREDFISRYDIIDNIPLDFNEIFKSK